MMCPRSQCLRLIDDSEQPITIRMRGRVITMRSLSHDEEMESKSEMELQ